MERRKFMIGVGSTAIGLSTLIGSGAFSSVEAERGFAVETANDASAYLALSSASDYAKVTDGMLELDFSSDNPTSSGGTGVNRNATTMFLHVFTIENQGTNTVGIQIDRPDLPGGATNHVHFFVGEHGGETLSAYDKEDMDSELDYGSPSNDDRVLEPGESLPVGIYFTNNGEEWDFDGTFTINALDGDTANQVSP
ncbi:DUF1102 domain-containing protein [Saliphagus sp. GCM10025334]